MTIPEAAAELGVSASTLRHQIKNRKLRAHKMGRGWYVAPTEVARYARDHRKGNGNDVQAMRDADSPPQHGTTLLPDMPA